MARIGAMDGAIHPGYKSGEVESVIGVLNLLFPILQLLVT